MLAYLIFACSSPSADADSAGGGGSIDTGTPTDDTGAPADTSADTSADSGDSGDTATDTGGGETGTPPTATYTHACADDFGAAESYVYIWPLDARDLDADASYACNVYDPDFIAWYEAYLNEPWPLGDYDCSRGYAMIDEDGPVGTTCGWIDARTEDDPDAWAGYYIRTVELWPAFAE